MKKVRIVLLLSLLLLMALFMTNCSVTVGWPFSWLGGPWAVTFDWGFLRGSASARPRWHRYEFHDRQVFYRRCRPRLPL